MKTGSKSTVTFNFCEANAEKPESCQEDAFAYVTSGDTCAELKPSDDNANTFGEEIRDEEHDVITGLKLTYAGGSQ